MNDDNDWEPTRFGGLRRVQRPGVAQSVERRSDEAKVESAHGSVHISGRQRTPDEAPRGMHDSKQGSWKMPRAGFKSLLPDTFIIRFHEKLGLPTCPYVIRWRIETPWGSVRLHHWLAPDDDRAKHDHPWNFVTFVLKGGYTDSSSSGDEHLKAPTVRYRNAEHQHTVFPDEGGAWTIIVTSPKLRKWGFWVNGKFVKMNKYFRAYGHHPCD